MEKYEHLSFVTQKEILADFARSLLGLKSEADAINFLVDLLTKEEVIKLAKRFKIAQLLLEGKEYRAIEQSLRVSHSTVAKVAAWLREGGDGFKAALKGVKKEKQEKASHVESFDLALLEWKRFKNRYAGAFWPSLLIEGIISSANDEQKDKMFHSLQKLDRKSKIYKEINESLKPLIKHLPKKK